jgi:signal transduction histidine kinase
MKRWQLPKSLGLAGWLAAGVCLSVSLLTWFGYRAIREWQRSSAQLVERRANETANLLVTALSHDMYAVQKSVLAAADRGAFALEPPHDLSNMVASAFARYPYPESFFTSQGSLSAPVSFFIRSDRPPAWAARGGIPNRFPVNVQSDSVMGRAMIEHISSDAAMGRRFSIFELTAGDTEYQVVARLLYRDEERQQLEGVFGFLVNMPWVRGHYFPELTNQIAQIGGATGMALAVFDETGARVATTRAEFNPGPVVRRSFPVMFSDPLLMSVDQPRGFISKRWTVEVGGAADPTLAAAIRGADRTLLLAACAAATLAFGLVLTARAVGASARLTELRSEFVATVTHELKTPIATIRAVGDTLVSGRLPTPSAQREYAQLVVQEAKRLTRLVDNLLALSRITDVTEVYLFEPLSVDSLIDTTLQEFGQQLAEAGFETQVEIPADLPPVRGDRTAMGLLLDNLVDNAIRYSPSTRFLRIGAHRQNGRVAIEVTDKGRGIPEDELDLVTRKFFRGRQLISHGSGLGLAIVKRIVTDHDGELGIRSSVSVGTTVSVELPISRDDDEKADSRR